MSLAHPQKWPDELLIRRWWNTVGRAVLLPRPTACAPQRILTVQISRLRTSADVLIGLPPRTEARRRWRGMRRPSESRASTGHYAPSPRYLLHPASPHPRNHPPRPYRHRPVLDAPNPHVSRHPGPRFPDRFSLLRFASILSSAPSPVTPATTQSGPPPLVPLGVRPPGYPAAVRPMPPRLHEAAFTAFWCAGRLRRQAGARKPGKGHRTAGNRPPGAAAGRREGVDTAPVV